MKPTDFCKIAHDALREISDVAFEDKKNRAKLLALVLLAQNAIVLADLNYSRELRLWEDAASVTCSSEP